MIFETGLLPYGRRVNERGFGTAIPDSGSGLVLRLSGTKRNTSREAYLRRSSKEGQLCVARVNFFRVFLVGNGFGNHGW